MARSLRRDELGSIKETGGSILHEVHWSPEISGELLQRRQMHTKLPAGQLWNLHAARWLWMNPADGAENAVVADRRYRRNNGLLLLQFTFFRCNTLTTNFCGKYCIVYLTNPPKCNATKKQRSLKSPQHEWFFPCLPCCMNHLNGPQIDLEILWRGSIPRLGDSGLSYWTVIYTSNSYAFTHILLLRVLYFHWGRCFILMFIGT